MDLTKKKAKELHNRFFYGHATEKEKEQLFKYVHQINFGGIGMYDPEYFSYYLMTSHPNYGKPDDDNIVSII